MKFIAPPLWRAFDLGISMGGRPSEGRSVGLRAAKDIDVSRPTFHDLLRKHGIDAAKYRRSDPDAAGGDEEGEPAEDSAEA